MRWQVKILVAGLNFVFSLLILSNTSAGVVYVSPDGNDSDTGESWLLSKKTVTAGLTAADNLTNNQVWVAAGTYNERITLKAGVALYGGFAGNETLLSQRDWTHNVTILNGQQGGSVVTSTTGATSSTRVDGFTIRNGTGTLSGSYRYGGGIYCDSSSPTISNNTISGNSLNIGNGGAIYCYNSFATITNNTIISNNMNSGSGGGIYCKYSDPIISNNTISANLAYDGGGIYCQSSDAIITNNTISGNQSLRDGGGIFMWYNSAPTIANNAINGNTAISGYGGGIACEASPFITNNTICGNSASYGGGLFFYSIGLPTLVNNAIAFNTSGIYNTGNPTLRNNCVYNPGADNYTNLAPGSGDINVDPLFVDRLNGNYHLSPSSLCINAGNDADVPAGWTDMDSQPRTGNPHVDIGADEFYPAGDCDGNGQVTAADMTIVLNNMDQSAGQMGYDARADLDADKSGTSTDLTIVLANME